MGTKRKETGFRERVERRQHYGVTSAATYSEKEVLKSLTQEIHKNTPDYIFLTETSATPWGPVIKEAYKEAYPGQKVPRFYRIDPSAIAGTVRDPLDPDKELQKTSKRKLGEYFDKRLDKKDPRVVIFDEMYGRGNSVRMVAGSLEEQGVDPSKIRVVLPKFIKGGEFVSGVELSPYMKLTSKEGQMTSLPPQWYEEKDISFTGNIIHGQAGRTLDYLRDAKSIGKKIGAEIRSERDAKNDLEEKISLGIFVVGLLGAFFFLSSTITGNTISSIPLGKSNVIGVGLLLLSLFGGTQWILLRRLNNSD